MIPSRELHELDAEIEKGEVRLGEVRRHIERLRRWRIDTAPAEQTLKEILDAQAERIARRAILAAR